MSNSRLVDDGVFVATDQPRPEPQLASALVNRLGLARASRAEKEQGIADWLTSHSPSDRLKNSLATSGYAHLLQLRA